jgi:hypothetical protein
MIYKTDLQSDLQSDLKKRTTGIPAAKPIPEKPFSKIPAQGSRHIRYFQNLVGYYRNKLSRQIFP